MSLSELLKNYDHNKKNKEKNTQNIRMEIEHKIE